MTDPARTTICHFTCSSRASIVAVFFFLSHSFPSPCSETEKSICAMVEKGTGRQKVREEGPLKKRLYSLTDYPFETNTNNSTRQGQFALEWLLDPIGMNPFFSNTFEKDPTLVNNKNDKSQSLITLPHIQNTMLAGKLRYGTDIYVTRYTV